MALVPGKLSTYRGRLSNPGQRSTIPDAYLKALSPKLYQTRLTNKTNATRTATNDKLYDPTRALSGSEIYSLAKAQVSAAYDPAINSAITDRKTAIANDAALAERVAGYQQMASGALASAHEAAQGGAKDLAAQLAATHGGLLASLDKDQANSQAGVASDTALRGADVTQGLSARLASDFQQQRAGVAANAAAQENAGNAGAQGWAGLIGMMQGAQAIRGADSAAQIGAANAGREYSLTQGIQDLRAKKGEAQTTQINSLRQSEFEKGAAIETLGIKQQTADTATSKAAFDAKYKTAVLKANNSFKEASQELNELKQRQAHGDRSAALNEKIKEANAREKSTARQLDIAQGNLDNARERTGIDAAKLPSAEDTKGQWLPPVAQAHAISDFHRLQSDPTLRKMRKDGKTRQEAADAITTSDKWGKLDPALITAALDMVYVGHLSPGTAAKLHRAKVKVSGLGVPVRHPSTKKTMDVSGIKPLTKKPQ